MFTTFKVMFSVVTLVSVETVGGKLVQTLTKSS